MKILHISDTHYQSEVMRRLEHLVHERHECDAVAVTGDCISNNTCDQVPPEWNKWPQRRKLSVPGNHDKQHTFKNLHSWTWTHNAPWKFQLDEVLFIGLGWPISDKDISHLKRLKGKYDHATDCVVLLSHERPKIEGERLLSQTLADLVGTRELLVLHGHEHPPSFMGSEWDDSGMLSGKRYYRSRVCTSYSYNRGIMHCIEWLNGSFSYEVIEWKK